MDFNFDRFELPNAGGNYNTNRVNRGKTEKADSTAAPEKIDVTFGGQKPDASALDTTAAYNQATFGINLTPTTTIDPTLLTYIEGMNIPFDTRYAYLSAGKRGEEATPEVVARTTTTLDTLNTTGNIEYAFTSPGFKGIQNAFRINEKVPSLDDPASYFDELLT